MALNKRGSDGESQDHRRESSPSRDTGKRAQDQEERREGHGGRACGSAGDSGHEVDDDHFRRVRASDDLKRRQHTHDSRDGYSRRRCDYSSSHRRKELEDARNTRRRHGDDVGAGASVSERQSRHYRHHESSGRDRSPHGRSSYRDRRSGHEEEHGRTSSFSHRDELVKKEADKHTGGDRFAMQSRSLKRNEDELPELFSVHRAKVQAVRPFGVFVRLEGFYKQGLVHISQLSDHEVTDREDSDEVKIKAIAAVAGEGDEVWVKVISLKDDGSGVKIGCSLKLVSQSTGKDLDPSNIKFEQQPKGNRQEVKKVTLDAIYNVVCSRCGGHGHLKTECYGTADKSYELIPEDDTDFAGQLPEPTEPQTSLGEVRAKPGFGRGRAMVLPAWMTHGSGAASSQQHSSPKPDKKKRKASELPDKISTVEEAMALIAKVKKSKQDKHHRKEHRKRKKDKKSKRTRSRD